MKRAFLLAAALFALTQTASAQSLRDFVGTWSVQTVNYRGDGEAFAALSGAMVIKRAHGALAMTLTTQSVDASDPAAEPVVAQETCTGRPQGAHLAITCTVVSHSSPEYQPDNFELDLSGDAMTGALNSAGSSVPVYFVRVP